MDSKQYARYTNAVETFLIRNHVKPGCHGPVDSQSEPFFSWRPCGCCGSLLGGSRENYSFAVEDGESFEENICQDCVYFLEYGRLDDMTMMEIEAEDEKARADHRPITNNP